MAKENKKLVALLVSSKNSPAVVSLVNSFKKNNTQPILFKTQESLYLYLVTHTPSMVLVSNKIEKGMLSAIITRLKKKYNLDVYPFEEEREGAGEAPSVKKKSMHFFKGEAASSGKALKSGSGEKDKKKPHLLILKKDGILNASKVRKENNQSGRLIHFGANETNTNGSVKVIEEKSKPRLGTVKNLGASKSLHQTKDFLPFELDKKEINKNVVEYFVLPLTSEEQSGYLIVDGDVLQIKNLLEKKFPEQLSPENVFKVGLHKFKNMKTEFLGSIEKKGEFFNLYFIKSKIPKVKIVRSQDKLSISAQHFNSDEVVNFDLYIYLEKNNKHFQYLSNGNSLSSDQLLRLKNKNKDLSVNEKDKDKLMSHIHLDNFKKEA